MKEFRKVVIDGITYNAITDSELKAYIEEIELKKELELNHYRIENGEIDTMSLEDFKSKYDKFYGV